MCDVRLQSNTLTVRIFKIREPYDEAIGWIHAQKAKIEGARYGRNLHSLEEGFREQEVLATEVDDFRHELDKTLNRTYDKEKKEKLESAYDELKDVSSKKIGCLKTMMEIASLEEHCNRLSRQMDLTSVGLVGPLERDHTAGQSGANIKGFLSPSSQDCVFGVKDNWEWVVKMVKCIDTHLQNGSNYHQFFHEIDECAPWMLQDLDKIQKTFETIPLTGEYDDAQRLMKELEDVNLCLKQWEAKTDALWAKASAVVPVHLRTDGVKEATPARLLCDYSTKEISVREGEDVILLDNSQENVWKIRTCRGDEGYVPALSVLIPGPYKAATDATVKLRLQLLASWTNAIKRLGKRLLCFMLLVFKPDYQDSEIASIRSIPRLDKQDLMRILDYIEDTLKSHWSDHEGFINLQERILALRMILEEVGDDGIKDEKTYNSLVVQITSLEKLMQKYKDIWDNWEMYKTSLEASQNPQLMLIVDKWEQLQFVTKDFFSKFWKNELPLDTMERSLMTLKTMTLQGDRLDVHDGVSPDESTGQIDGWEERSVSGTRHESDRELSRARKVDLRDALGTPEQGLIQQDGGFDETRVLERRVVSEVERAPPVRSKVVDIQQALGTAPPPDMDREWQDSRTVEKRIVTETTTESEIPVNSKPQESVSQDSGWQDTRVVESMLQSSQKPLYNRSRIGQVDIQTALGGVAQDGVDESRQLKTYTTAQYSVPELYEGEEVFEEGLTEEGITENTELGYHGVRASRLSTEGSDFGYAHETRTAETEQVQSAEVEEEKTFIIQSVISPVDGTEISLQQAILEGVIRPDQGTYLDTKTGTSVHIAIAMANGLIKVQFTSTRRGQEKRSSMGIITVKTIREPVRPHVIRTVTDTSSGQRLPKDEAARAGILNESRGIYTDRKTGTRMLVVEAIEKGLVQVEYTGEAPPPEVVAKTYAVRAVVDRRWKKVVTFAEAVRRGIIDKDKGQFRDTQTGDTMYVGDAIMRGYLKARKIDRAASLDIDPQNKMLVDKTETIRKKVLQPLKVISAFRRAAKGGMAGATDANNN